MPRYVQYNAMNKYITSVLDKNIHGNGHFQNQLHTSQGTVKDKYEFAQ